MLLRFFTLLVSVLAIGQVNWQDFQLNGRVKNLSSITYSFSNPNQTEVSGFLDSELYDRIDLEFDSKGSLIQRKNYLDYQGKIGLFDYTIYRYNYNNQIEFQETTLVQNGEEPKKISQKKTYYYLQNGLIRLDELNFGRTQNQNWTTNFTYKNGAEIRSVTWMEDEIYAQQMHEIDIANRTIQTKQYSNDGKVRQIKEYIYKPKVEIVEITTTYGNTKIIEKYYYSKGKLRKKEINKPDEIIKIDYNSYGYYTLVQKEKNSKQLKQITNYQFDYQFDSFENWVMCQISTNNKPTYVIKRTIDYHKM